MTEEDKSGCDVEGETGPGFEQGRCSRGWGCGGSGVGERKTFTAQAAGGPGTSTASDSALPPNPVQTPCPGGCRGPHLTPPTQALLSALLSRGQNIAFLQVCSYRRQVCWDLNGGGGGTRVQ